MDGMEARARRSDPATSHEAARDVEWTGKAGSQRKACYEYVRRYPGATAAEIAKAIGLERHVPSRRLPELRDAGLIKNGASRVCGIMARNSLTWLPEPDAPMSTKQKDMFQ